MGKFEIKVRKDGQFLFNLKAGNGEKILTSEAYTSKAACKKGIDFVKKNVKFDKLFIRLESKDGKPYFNFTSESGQILGTSEMYENRASMENGIDSVKKNAPRAKL